VPAPGAGVAPAGAVGAIVIGVMLSMCCCHAGGASKALINMLMSFQLVLLSTTQQHNNSGLHVRGSCVEDEEAYTTVLDMARTTGNVRCRKLT
jgi:hypothetical protein